MAFGKISSVLSNSGLLCNKSKRRQKKKTPDKEIVIFLGGSNIYIYIIYIYIIYIYNKELSIIRL
jgi:hypothetical protein